MPSSKYFDRCPPFPSDVPVAEIPVISLQRLKQNDAGEAAKLFDACRQYGFFSLRLSESDEGRDLLRNAETMFDLTDETLNLDRSSLDEFQFNPPKDLLGYKAAGKSRMDNGQLDSTEMYMLGQDDMLGSIAPRRNPLPIEAHRTDCQDFFQHAYAAIAVVMGALDQQLGLEKGTLAAMSSLGKASATSLRLLLTRPHDDMPDRSTLGAHTDIGLITLLFNAVGGLQILPAESENEDKSWRYIRPEMGCALINIGDTMAEWTGGVLRSSLHRVVSAPGAQKNSTRISLAYLVRPARGELMKRLPGRVIPAAEDGTEETRTVDEWAAERTAQILKGTLRPRTTGGAPLAA